MDGRKPAVRAFRGLSFSAGMLHTPSWPDVNGSREENAMQIDPVCGMEVDEGKAKATSTHSGTTYYFCSPECQEEFETDPESYLEDFEDSDVEEAA